MRTDGKMSYKDYIFPINPSVIKIVHGRKIAAEDIPYGNDTVNDLGGKRRIITGEGEFCGDNCENDFLGLKKVMDEGGSGMLYIPSQKPVCAVAELLEMTASDTENLICYRFRFVECFENSSPRQDAYHFASEDECLWDIAYQYGISIDILTECNPHICRPDINLDAGERVNLC